MPDANKQTTVSEQLRKVLDFHGYAFQQAVVRRTEELKDRHGWRFIGTEYPVELAGLVTHIDLVYGIERGRGHTYLVGECKRADPAKACWAFARSRYTNPGTNQDQAIFDVFTVSNKSLRPGRKAASISRGVYDIAVELKTGATGDGSSSGRTIETAVSQVLRGASGLAFSMITNLGETPDVSLRIVPVIFTTAELWTTEADLSTADLATGKLGVDLHAQQVDWLWLNYNRSENLRPVLERPKNNFGVKVLAERMPAEFTRSIAIVSPLGIDDFLTTDLHAFIGNPDPL